jgi:cysteine-rich repeat protein
MARFVLGFAAAAVNAFAWGCGETADPPQPPIGAGTAGGGTGGAVQEAGGAGTGGASDDAGDAEAGEASPGGAAGADAADAPSYPCGDGVTDPGEQCDDGDYHDDNGCTTSCTFTCSDDTDCDDHLFCSGHETCTPEHLCEGGAALPDGTPCGQNATCQSGWCLDAPLVCGDGFQVVGPEECDDWNQISGDGCEYPSCQFTCVSSDPDRDCTPADPCAGQGICTDAHVCTAGTPLADGTPCGAGMICQGGSCLSEYCGNGTVDGAEECDDSNTTAGDGCTDCQFDCLSSDPGRDCSGGDPCPGPGSCNDATHLCSYGSPLPDDTSCGPSGEYCKAGVCTSPGCPNGDVEPGEQCDDGNPTGGDGCDADCTWSCATPASDCGAPPVCQKYQCDADHVCEAVADATQNGQSCGSGLQCQDGACTGGVCGNGIVEAGEQCDFGSGFNGPGTGCETSCQLSCSKSPDSCPDADPCNGTETCVNVTVNGKAGQKCQAGSPLGDGTACGSGSICLGGQCKVSVCGDGWVDSGRGEDCEPPNAAGCDASCHTACDLTGTWATYIELDVTWPAKALVYLAGSGKVKQWVRVTRTHTGNSTSDVMLPCGAEIPDFRGDAYNETYGIIFPDALFDNVPAYLPANTVTGTLSGSSPGSSYTTPASATLMGLTMANPETDAWPASYTGVTPVDHDQDAKPGITATVKSGTAPDPDYANLPLAVLFPPRADRVYLAVRQVTSVAGALTTCSEMSGTATVSKQDSHVVGCRKVGGGDCSAAQTDFLDTNRVQYTIGAATFVSRKVTAGATCAIVRSSVP